MATTTAMPKMTAEEFYVWANRPERGGRLYELEAGEVVEMQPPGEIHGLLCAWITHMMWEFALRRGSGRVLSNDTGLVVRRAPDTVRGPDIMFFLSSRRLEDASPRHVTDVPDLVTEVFSPNDRAGRLNHRIEQYHQSGVPLVWVVYPEDLTVSVYRPGEFPKTLDETDDLTGNGVLPDFRCRVSDFFELAAPPAPTASP
ncbi:MAG: Uma2 family endonuclease, partial [Fimbriiglobus sp.]